MQELVRGYYHDEGEPRCAIKLDLMKAYDSEDWHFLFDTMLVMGFPSLFVHWIKQCVCITKYSVVINGSLEGFFQGKRGLKQGEPISPYLFLIVMEAFSVLLNFRVGLGQFNYHPRCRELNLHHLVLADDLFIMCGATVSSFTLIDQLLKDFHAFSGLKPNKSKSSSFFVGVNEKLKQSLKNILPIPEAFFPVKYLGVPLIATILKATDCLALKEKIRSAQNSRLFF